MSEAYLETKKQFLTIKFIKASKSLIDLIFNRY